MARAVGPGSMWEGMWEPRGPSAGPGAEEPACSWQGPCWAHTPAPEGTESPSREDRASGDDGSLCQLFHVLALDTRGGQR